MMGPINSAVSDVFYAALLDGVYPKQRGDISLAVSCLTVVSTSLVYCNTIRHRDVAVKLRAHFCKYNSLRPSSPGRYTARPLLAGNTPLSGFGTLSVGDLVLTGQGLLWRQVAQNVDKSKIREWQKTTEPFSFSLDILWSSLPKRHCRTPDSRLSRRQTFP